MEQNKPWPKIDWDKIIGDVLLIDGDDEAHSHYWVRDGYLYGTGKYKVMIQKMIDEQAPQQKKEDI